VLTARDVSDAERLERVFARANAARRPRGNAFCAQIGNRIYACNPWENWDKPSWCEVPLDKPFLSLRAELPVHSWLVGVQRGEVLLLHLNGREERETRLDIKAEGKVEMRASPEGRGVRVESFSGGRATIVVPHAQGWCDLEIVAKP